MCQIKWSFTRASVSASHITRTASSIHLVETAFRCVKKKESVAALHVSMEQNNLLNLIYTASGQMTSLGLDFPAECTQFVIFSIVLCGNFLWTLILCMEYTLILCFCRQFREIMKMFNVETEPHFAHPDGAADNIVIEFNGFNQMNSAKLDFYSAELDLFSKISLFSWIGFFQLNWISSAELKLISGKLDWEKDLLVKTSHHSDISLQFIVWTQ